MPNLEPSLDALGYIADRTFRKEEGTSFDKWIFIWRDEVTIVAVNTVNERFDILTDHLEDRTAEILNYTKKKLESLQAEEDLEEFQVEEKKEKDDAFLLKRRNGV